MYTNKIQNMGFTKPFPYNEKKFKRNVPRTYHFDQYRKGALRDFAKHAKEFEILDND